MNKVKAFFQSHQDLSYWLLFTGLATFILFFISPDSYFNDMHNRCDSAWFFMCGKAWMNGLIPYVDFADSKGPFLWLIYGIGYIISPNNYLGVFWISCLWYGGTYFFTYKTAKLFLPERKSAIICTIMMSLAFFNPWFHDEIRAEDFCLLFITISLYELCNLAWGDVLHVKRRFFVLGICFSALFLIKFNIAAMQAIIVLGSFYVLFRAKRPIGKPLLWEMGGVVAFFLPFLIYFLLAGNFTSFIYEYIINTLSSVSGLYSEYSPNLFLRTQFQYKDSPVITYLFEWAGLIFEPQVGSLFIFLIIGGIFFSSIIKKRRYLILCVTILYFSVVVRHHFSYYFTICAPFLLFLLIGLFSRIKIIPNYLIYFLSSIIIIVSILSHICYFNYKLLFFNNNESQTNYYEIAGYIHQVPHPTIASAGCQEYGFGTIDEVLPSGKYWALQNGAPERMKEEHRALILSGKADFIIARWFRSMNTRVNLTLEEIVNAGYHIVCYFDEGGVSVLLSKKDLKEPTLSIPSKWEVFKKHFSFSEINE